MFSKKYRRADKSLTAKLKHHGKWLRNSVTVTLAMGMTAWIAIPTGPVEGAQIIASGAWIGVNAPSLTLPVGTSYHIFFRLFGVTNNNTHAPEAVLDNPSIGTYDASTGVFTAGTKPGTGTLTIQMRDASDLAPVNIPITVTAGPLDHVAIDPQTTSMETRSAQQFTLVGFDRYGNNVDLSGTDPTWGASGNLGDFWLSGLFVATGAGNTAITATLGGISATADVRIYGQAAVFDVTTDGPVVVGKPTVLHVRVADAQGNSGPSYAGPVYLAAGGGDVSMPSSIKVSGDAFEVPVTFHTAGQVSLGLSSQKPSDDIDTLIAEFDGQTVSGTTTINVQAAAPDTSDLPVKVNGAPFGTIHCLVSDQEYVSLDSVTQFLNRMGIQVSQPAASGRMSSSLQLKVPKWMASKLLAAADPVDPAVMVVTESIHPVSLPKDIHQSLASTGASEGKDVQNLKAITVPYMSISDVENLCGRVGLNAAFSADEQALEVSAPLTISGNKPVTPGQSLTLYLSWELAGLPAPANLVQWQSGTSGAIVDPDGVFQAVKPGDYEVTGTYNGIPATGNVTVDLVVSRVQISVGPPTAYSNQVYDYPVTVTAYDSQNRPMPNVSLEFSSMAGNGAKGDQIVKTDQQGTYATRVAFVAPTGASETGVIRATAASGVSDSAAVTYGVVTNGGSNNKTPPSPPVPVPSRIQPTTPSVTSAVYMNPSDSTAFQFTVFTSSGDPVPNTLVDFSVNGGLSVSGLDHAAATTDANGVATVHYAAISSDTDGHIHAVVHGSTISTDSAAIHVSIPAPASIQVTPASGSSQYVAVNQPTTVTFAVYDSSGQTVPGVQLHYDVQGSDITRLSATSGTTNSQGLATVTYTPPALNDTDVTVTASVYGSPGVNASSGHLWPISFENPDSLDPIRAAAGSQVQVTFQARDNHENPVSGVPVSFHLNSLYGQLDVSSGVTGVDGNTTVTYTVNPLDVGGGQIVAVVDNSNVEAYSPTISASH